MQCCTYIERYYDSMIYNRFSQEMTIRYAGPSRPFNREGRATPSVTRAFGVCGLHGRTTPFSNIKKDLYGRICY